jgi:plasmid stability protein
MPKMIQIRNVPDDLHHELRRRALAEGISLSEYLLRLARKDVAQPTMKEWLEQVASREPVRLSQSSVELIREERDSR